MIYSDGSMREPTRNIATSELERNQFCINDQDALMLAGYAIQIEKHYTARAGVPTPMDIEWAKDGIDGQLYIVQARPETVASMQKGTTLEQFVLKESTVPLVTGHAVGGRIAQGNARIINRVDQLSQFKAGEVLVADITTPDWEPVMKIASAIVTQSRRTYLSCGDRGARTQRVTVVLGVRVHDLLSFANVLLLVAPDHLEASGTQQDRADPTRPQANKTQSWDE